MIRISSRAIKRKIRDATGTKGWKLFWGGREKQHSALGDGGEGRPKVEAMIIVQVRMITRAAIYAKGDVVAYSFSGLGNRQSYNDRTALNGICLERHSERVARAESTGQTQSGYRHPCARDSVLSISMPL